MAMNIVTALNAIKTALDGVAGLRTFKFIPDSISPPAAVVDLDEIIYDNTKGRGTDRATFTVTVAVGKVVDRAAHDQVAGYMSGTGAATTAIKAALDAIGPHVQVLRARKAIVMFASQEFLGATFDVDYVA